MRSLGPLSARRALVALLPVLVIVNFIYFYSATLALQLLAGIAPVWKSDPNAKYYVVEATWADANEHLKALGAQAKVLPQLEDEVKKQLASKLAESNSDWILTMQKQVEAEYRQLYYDTLNREKPGLAASRQKFFLSIVTAVMVGCAPKRPFIKRKGEALWGNMVREVASPLYSRRHLTYKRTKLSEDDFADLQTSHDAAVAAIRQLPVPASSIYAGSGVVISASKLHLPGAVNVVIQLRELGSKLPVEVFVDSEASYNKHVCEVLLPRFNAKCMVIERELGPKEYRKYALEKFQMKALAILLSSFDHTIVLDADNYPIKNVDALFASEPYQRTKFILWPDIWHKGAAPLYYEIARFTPGEPVRRNGLRNDGNYSEYVTKNKETDVLFHDLDGLPTFTSVESGQLVVSKKEHFRALLLATYYNFHGPGYYYPLLYQGTFGSGDRETFVPALHVMSEPYYLTEWEVIFSGLERERPTKKGEFYYDETTMVQRDPQQAMAVLREWRAWLEKSGMDLRLYPFQQGEYTTKLRDRFFAETGVKQPDVMFLHVHDPKINTLANELSEKARYDYKSRYIKPVGMNDVLMGHRDWELRFQAINAWTTCHGLKEDIFLGQTKTLEQKELCEKAKGYVEKLKEDSNDVDAAKLTVVP